MKALFGTAVLLGMVLCFVFAAFAQDITAKQGLLYMYEDNAVKNFSCIEIIKTKANPEWPKWANALWNGNSLEAGIAYDLAGINSVALMIGHRLGSLADILPLEYPILAKADITIYPIGVAIKEPFDGPEAQLASGLAIVKVSLKF